MSPARYLTAIAAMICIGALPSCRKDDSASKAYPEPPRFLTSRILVDPKREGPFERGAKLIECPQEEAEVFLVVEFGLPKVFGAASHVFPMKWTELYDKRGFKRQVRTSPFFRMQCADGATKEGRGFGWRTGVNLVDSTGNEVTIEAYCGWEIPDQTSGTFEKKVRARLYETVEQQFAEGARIRASWRAAPQE